MNILITGSAGFIGSHLSEQLLEENHNVIGIDCFTDNYTRTIKEKNLTQSQNNNNFKFHELNLASDDISFLLKDIDIIFHLAALPGVRDSWGTNFSSYIEHNIKATQILLEQVKKYSNIKKIIFVSSSSVYGNKKEYPLHEDMTLNPSSPYGVTKLAAEKLCLSYYENYNIPIVILRYFSVYGPRQRPDMGFYKFINTALTDKEIIIYGNGMQTRDFTYVADIIDATIKAMKKGVNGNVYNIGCGNQIKLIETISIMEKILNKKFKIKFIEKAKGDVSCTFADITKAKKDFDYHPNYSIRQGIEEEIKWITKILAKKK